ncbi:hypothetical protein CEUSTIGMA_g11306.t1 [Chlamydomonas eustigma]|uniref:Uncharacterized protein n=1 Tax=Chlamydomonas eustigma TaxID=1157962 RepID=A0A250XLA3_9CHLO|nr:hypothetical protein CEUSTIGMA_g11306.t1 [Chlamydomonas eustigma]|eukprot:GAX83881.1 hypothetical protein CEUSTIGMA_g11306.t1 [Chlamydomonas eustigma]
MQRGRQNYQTHWLDNLDANNYLLEESAPGEGAPTHSCGVSLYFIHLLLAHSKAHFPKQKTTASFVTEAIIPLTASRNKCRFYDILQENHKGPPSYYISHAWGASFTGLLEQLLHHLVPTGCLPAKRSYYKGIVEAAKQCEWTGPHVYIWLDFMAVNQHLQTLNSHAPSEITIVREVLEKSCENGVVAVADLELLLLTRTWCLYEIWTCVHDSDVSRLRVIFSPSITSQEVAKYESQCAQLELVSGSESTKPDDKMRIVSELRSSTGLKLMHEVMKDVLLTASRASLRWEGKLREQAIYCIHLLEAGEYGLLLHVLQTVSGIEDGGENLRNIMRLIDEAMGDRTGLIPPEVFLRVLDKAGFASDEAEDIFFEIGGGNDVSKEAFRKWWLKDSGPKSSLTPDALTSESLLKALESYEAILAASGLNDLSSLLSQLRIKKSHSQSLQPGKLLTPPDALGDWMGLADKVSFKLHDKDFKSPIFIMREFLLRNGTFLSLNPLSLKKPVLNEMKEVAIVLVEYLEIFLSLMRMQTNSRFYCEHFASVLKHLKDPKGQAAMRYSNASVGTHTNIVAAKSVTSALHEHEKHKILREMVSLKYGANRPITGPYITEAEISLAGLSSKRSQKGGEATRKSLDAFNGMSQSYLQGAAGGTSGLKAAAGSAGSNIDSNFLRAIRGNTALESDQSVLMRLGPEAEAFALELKAAQDQKASAYKQQGGAGGVAVSHSVRMQDGNPFVKDMAGGVPGADKNMTAMTRMSSKRVPKSLMDFKVSGFDELRSQMQQSGTSVRINPRDLPDFSRLDEVHNASEADEETSPSQRQAPARPPPVTMADLARVASKRVTAQAGSQHRKAAPSNLMSSTPFVDTTPTPSVLTGVMAAAKRRGKLGRVVGGGQYNNNAASSESEYEQDLTVNKLPAAVGGTGVRSNDSPLRHQQGSRLPSRLLTDRSKSQEIPDSTAFTSAAAAENKTTGAIAASTKEHSRFRARAVTDTDGSSNQLSLPKILNALGEGVDRNSHDGVLTLTGEAAAQQLAAARRSTVDTTSSSRLGIRANGLK